MTEQITFEWARQNRHNNKLAEFVFLFCPPMDTPDTPSIYQGKRDVWLSKLSEALDGAMRGTPQQTKEQQIIAYKNQGMTKQQIADKMGISLNTVKRAYRNLSTACG